MNMIKEVQGSTVENKALVNATNYGQLKFSVTQTDMGESIYEWMDTEVENYSSIHLAKILRSLDAGNVIKNSGYYRAVKQELINRGQYQASKAWCF